MSASDAISVQTDFGHAVFVFVGWRSHKFWGNLCSGYTTHSVMVVITVNPKIFGGIGGTEEVLPRVEIFTVPLQSPTTRLQAAAKHHRCTTNRNNHQHLATSHVMHTRKKWTVRQQNHQALETMRTPASACE
uniref:Uncharacterized protein n=1 Tax=Brassica campestris TaxID=3711 RepID=M4EEF3_BRACM